MGNTEWTHTTGSGSGTRTLPRHTPISATLMATTVPSSCNTSGEGADPSSVNTAPMVRPGPMVTAGAEAGAPARETREKFDSSTFSTTIGSEYTLAMASWTKVPGSGRVSDGATRVWQ